MTFRVEWDGNFFQNTAHAVAIMTIDTTRFPNPGFIAPGNFDSSVPLAFHSLTMTLSGAAAGNGTYTRSDYDLFSWSTNGAVLDFSRELVGQPTSGDSWGDIYSFNTGGFSLYTNNPSAPNSAYSKSVLRTSNYEHMNLISFRPLTTSSVPEPSTALLFAVGTGVVAVLERRRMKKNLTLP